MATSLRHRSTHQSSYSRNKKKGDLDWEKFRVQKDTAQMGCGHALSKLQSWQQLDVFQKDNAPMVWVHSVSILHRVGSYNWLSGVRANDSAAGRGDGNTRSLFCKQ